MATLDDLKDVFVSVQSSIEAQTGVLTSTLSAIEAQNSIIADTLEVQRSAADAQRRATELSRSARTSAASSGTGKGGGIGGVLSGTGSLLSGGGGLLSGLGTGIGFAGAGIGAALLGLSTVMDKIPDADAIKDNVETLLSIGEGYESRLDFFMESGTLALALAGLGVGLALFAIGSGATAGVQYAIEKFEMGNWAKTVKENVLTLLSIGDGLAVGNLQLLFEGAAVGTALAGLGIGLAAFAIGSGAQAAVDYFSQGSNWAENVKTNVNTLLSIGDDKTAGALQVLFEGVGVSLALTGLGVGLVAFSAGQGVASAVDYFSEDNWAQKVKDNVETLLSISNLEGVGWDTTAFIGIMTGLGLGLAAFALGKGVDTVVEGMDQALNYFTGENDFAQRIYDQVAILLSIPNMPGIGGDVAGFIAAMTGIATGLAIFALGKGADTAVEGMDQALNYFTGEDNFAQRIYDQVSTLMSVTDLTDEGRATQFASALGIISAGILAFTTADFLGTLADVGQTILGFFGVQSPFEKIMEIADKSEDLIQGAEALEKIANALTAFGNISVSKIRIDFEQLATDLGKAIPLLRGLATGGVVGAGWLSRGIDFEKGILDPELRLNEIADRINLVRKALGADITAGQQTVSEISVGTQEDIAVVSGLTTQMIELSQNILSSLEIIERNASASAAASVVYAPTTVAPTTQVFRGGDSQTQLNSYGGRDELAYGSRPGGVGPF